MTRTYKECERDIQYFWRWIRQHSDSLSEEHMKRLDSISTQFKTIFDEMEH